MHLVDAQQARRILDRLVGFEVVAHFVEESEAKFVGRSCSIGFGPKLIVEREREVEAHTIVQSAFRVIAIFRCEG
jgi:DNA topoisomerase-1